MVLLVLVAATQLFAALQFANEPVITVNPSGGYFVEFQVNENIDVEVSIVDTVKKQVVRRLGAGVLGSNAPAPFALNALSQKITWDGKDDAGQNVTINSCIARVRAGMLVALDKIVGQNDYLFFRAIQGLALDSAGNLYAFGPFPWLAHHGTSGMTLRRYSRSGEYDRTLWPVPAGLDPSAIGSLKIIGMSNSKYFPKTEAMDAPQLGNSPLTYENSFICPQLVDGKVMVVTCAFSSDASKDPSYRLMTIGADGVPGASSFLVKSPALPKTTATTCFNGPSYLTLSPDNKYFLLSGCYQSNIAGTDTFPASTGFWREGHVYKVDKVSGAATILISIDSTLLPKTASTRRALIGPTSSGSLSYMAAIHGTAFDDSGHIFICDRVRNELGIYDTNGVRIGGIAVTNPDQVVYNKKTGALYVLTRQFSYSFNNSYPPVAGTGTLSLVKFASRHATTGTTVTVAKQAAVLYKSASTEDMQKSSSLTYGRVNMVIDCSGSNAVIWLNGFGGGSNFCVDSNLTNIRGYRDNGSNLELIKDFRQHTRRACNGFDRVTVDRRSEKVYVNDSWTKLYKVVDWSNPVLTACSTSTGALSATDVAVSPDGFLYVREGLYTGPLKRYTQDAKHAPANFVGRGTNVVVPTINLGYGGGSQDKGIAVTKTGRIYVYNGSYLNAKLQVYDTMGTLVKDNVVGLGCSAGGVKVDDAGKIYISASMLPSTVVQPPEFTGYWPAAFSTGVVIKFDPVTGGSFGNTADDNPANRTVNGALKVYSIPVSPFSGTFKTSAYVPSSRWACVCRTPRFDLDEYGRIIAPHTVVGRVTLADNAGNEILSFGEYGNADSKGVGSAIPGPSIPLAWPAGVAASEDYIYVTDLVNARLVRVRKLFKLDNTGLMGEFNGTASAVQLDPSLTSVPEPFNPVSKITVSLPVGTEVRIDVVDMSGKIVKNLKNGFLNSGKTTIYWDATDSNGHKVAGGIYVYKMTTSDRRVVTKRTAYVR
ncbi:MAG: hypothetical protein JNL74_05315 [Fibrobacteres bacterium]|nr:hypothetical protein [Fibrobacterota bacterium]